MPPLSLMEMMVRRIDEADEADEADVFVNFPLHLLMLV